jgi:hypothetical protein
LPASFSLHSFLRGGSQKQVGVDSISTYESSNLTSFKLKFALTLTCLSNTKERIRDDESFASRTIFATDTNRRTGHDIGWL